ncbi:MAG: precorrin-4 C(11)-methyltransferase [Halanaerobiales bacterium]|nr:precorrin-4 C(11)-methyltransferase [Halanaerobiales bacterium]
MKIFFIGAGAGDPELLTIKGQKVLKDCRIVIYAGSLVNPAILKYAEQAEVYNSAGMTLEEVLAMFEKAWREDQNLARIHTGDPSLYGATQEQFDYLTARGIPFEVIPGVSSFSAAAASLKREFTLPDISQTVILTRMAGRTGVPVREKLANLAQHQASMVIFLSVQLIDEVVQELQQGYAETTPATVIYRASWPEQRIITGSLANIAERVKTAGLKNTALILVGDFLHSNYSRSKLYDPDFSHSYRQKQVSADQKAILVVSFGTSYPETRKLTIEACEEEIGRAFPDYELRRAFTSRMIINKLKSRDNMIVDTPGQALQKLKRKGFSTVIVQPLHIIPGHEYHDLLKDVALYRADFTKLLVGKPLLYTEQDYDRLVEALLHQLPVLREDEGIVLAGHGSSHPANASYACLDYVLKGKGQAQVFVANVEGFPEIEQVIDRLIERRIKKVTIVPLMLVAGDHVHHDLVGPAEDSWQTILEEKGFIVRSYLHGLGENSQIRAIYLHKAKEAEDYHDRLSG